MKISDKKKIACFSLILGSSYFLLIAALAQNPPQQNKFTELDRRTGRYILKTIEQDLKENYYDPTFHGVDIDALFKKADELIGKAQSTNEIWEIIAPTLMVLNDSHTLFIPPQRQYYPIYGWDMKMFGDDCLVYLVEPGSDAEQKGLKEGDRILSIGGVKPTKNNLWVIDYLYGRLRPTNGKHLVVQSPDGTKREFDAMAKLKEHNFLAHFDSAEVGRSAEYHRRKQLMKNQFQELSKDVIAWKYPTFVKSEQNVADAMRKVKKYKSMILDLRDNSGGYIDTLVEMLGYFFDQNIIVGEEKWRGKSRMVKTQNQGNYGFKGELIVLVDSQSASAAEIFSRTIQLQKRGLIIGDQTAGKVVAAQKGAYASISVMDFFMSDGKRLENVGVTPDEIMIPNPTDLAHKRDPVLASAASKLGVKIDPEKAGQFFQIDWKSLPKL